MKRKKQSSLTPRKSTRSSSVSARRRAERYRTDKAYREKAKETARERYREAKNVDLSSCLYSLDFIAQLADETNVILPNGRKAFMPVISQANAAAALQIDKVTFYRRIQRGQLPPPLIRRVKRNALVYHVDEVKALISVIGEHEKSQKYLRRDHTATIDAIWATIGRTRVRLNIQTKKTGVF